MLLVLLLRLQRCLLLHILLLDRRNLLLLLLWLVECCLWLAKPDRGHWAQATCTNNVETTLSSPYPYQVGTHLVAQQQHC
jgi:hypothetical protein